MWNCTKTNLEFFCQLFLESLELYIICTLNNSNFLKSYQESLELLTLLRLLALNAKLQMTGINV